MAITYIGQCVLLEQGVKLALPQPCFQLGENIWRIAQNNSPVSSTYGLTRYTEFRIGGIPNPKDFPLLGAANATTHVETSGKL